MNRAASFAILFALLGLGACRICIDDCFFEQSFDVPFITSNQCNKTQSTFLCQVQINIDHVTRKVRVVFGSDGSYLDDRRRSLDEPYDYVNEQTTVNQTVALTKLFYSCTTADRCEENYLMYIASKLIAKDMKRFQMATETLFSPVKISYPTCRGNGYNVCNGSCYSERTRLIDMKTGKLSEKIIDQPSCQSGDSASFINIIVDRIPMGNVVLNQRIVSVSCVTNSCNDSDMLDRVETIVNENFIPYYQLIN